MEALESSANVNSYGGSRDKTTRHARVIGLAIDCRMPNAQAGSHLLPFGECKIDVLTTELEAIMARSWDDDEQDRLDMATDDFNRLIDADLKEEVDETSLAIGDFREKVAAIMARPIDQQSKQDKDWLSKRETILDGTGDSVEACFHKRHGRTIKPFVSVEVIGDEKPVPEEEQSLEHNKAQMLALMQLLKGGLGDSDNPLLAKLDEQSKQMAEMKAQIAEMQDAATAPTKSKGNG